MDAFASLKRLLSETEIAYALIGAYAVNVYLEPRNTADVDLVVQATEDNVEALKDILQASSFSIQFEHKTDEAPVPDIIRFKSADHTLVVDVQISKTDFQREVIDRAVDVEGFRVATAEDLIVMKLIANRVKDRIDLEGLITLPEIDWKYVQKWAEMWDVDDRLASLKSR